MIIMKILIVYDSVFGNTEKVVNSIAKILGERHQVDIQRINSLSLEALNKSELLIIGSPTRGFKATKPINGFISDIPLNVLSKINICVFDTRIRVEKINNKLSRFIVRKGGYASEKMIKQLEKKKANIIYPANAFYVVDTEGPLEEGELERAENWVKSISIK